jgi:ribosomal protein L29
MKKKEIQELKNKPPGELQKLLSDKRAELRTLTFDREAGKVQTESAVRALRKHIARILTFMHSPPQSLESKN